MDITETVTSKIDATNAVADALRNRISNGQVTDVGDVVDFLDAWQEGLRSLVPSGKVRTYRVGDTEPPIGTELIDHSGDRWIHCNNGLWNCSSTETVEDRGTVPWTSVTEYAPLKPRN